VSLPLAGSGDSLPVPRPGESTTTLLMNFDGKTVFLGRELPPEAELGKGRVYLVNISGPSPVEPPPERMTWPDYQAWLDRMRGEGHTLTTHNLSPCQSGAVGSCRTTG
jgi:hypothetical protein